MPKAGTSTSKTPRRKGRCLRNPRLEEVVVALVASMSYARTRASKVHSMSTRCRVLILVVVGCCTERRDVER